MTTATMTATVPTVTFMLPPKSDWQTGFDLFMDGKSEKHCINRGQVEGWWYANHCFAAAAVMDAVAEGHIESYEDWRYPVRMGM